MCARLKANCFESNVLQYASISYGPELERVQISTGFEPATFRTSSRSSTFALNQSSEEPKKLNEFEEFCMIDLRKSKRTTYEKTWHIRRFLEWFRRSLDTATSIEVEKKEEEVIDTHTQISRVKVKHTSYALICLHF